MIFQGSSMQAMGVLARQIGSETDLLLKYAISTLQSWARC